MNHPHRMFYFLSPHGITILSQRAAGRAASAPPRGASGEAEVRGALLGGVGPIVVVLP